ncbi:hypothetical protein VIGAN_10085300 [Vigna angularis var. angularis]|uniref:Retrotransposon gag domain-containing protein n=1 Tax=Vigna angularis var. angularis TaxID=157739 RepID=A0A0S3T2G4_PHAAN|nr:hypothetical protein VIGAN_10085300 [Vigna angularis var. angularis]
MRMMGARAHNNDEQSGGSQAYIKGNQRRCKEDIGGRVGGDYGGTQTHNHCGDHQEVQNQWRKRGELTAFEGLDPLNWINRAERVFELQGVAEEEKVQFADLSMEGSAGYWFRAWKEKAKNRSWDGLKEALVIRFGTIVERLAASKHVTTGEEYVQGGEKVRKGSGIEDKSSGGRTREAVTERYEAKYCRPDRAGLAEQSEADRYNSSRSRFAKRSEDIEDQSSWRRMSG